MNKSLFIKRLLLPLLVALLVIFIFLVPFIIKFNDAQLSFNSEDWGAFGGYLSGVISIINLFVFISLSYLIGLSDDNRSRYSIENQKLITLTEFRQKELERLTIELDEALICNGEESKSIVASKIGKGSIHLTTFFNQKCYLFPILSSTELVNLQNNINEILVEIQSSVILHHGNKLTEDKQRHSEQLFLSYFKYKADLLHILQVYILSQLK